VKSKKARVWKTFVPSNTSQSTGHILKQCRIREAPNQLYLTSVYLNPINKQLKKYLENRLSLIFMVYLSKQSEAQIMYRLLVKSLLSNELKMKGNEVVKANYKYISNMFKGNKKRCMSSHNRQVSCRLFTWIPVK
jgi:hypothetical protein